MDKLNGLVIRIEEGVMKLRSELNSDRSALKHCEGEIIELERQLKEKETELDTIKKEHEALKMAVAVGTAEGGNEAARKKINELVREIDKCMALLNA